MSKMDLRSISESAGDQTSPDQADRDIASIKKDWDRCTRKTFYWPVIRPLLMNTCARGCKVWTETPTIDQIKLRENVHHHEDNSCIGWIASNWGSDPRK
jgi:hypothetical protein